ncbi:MAG: helix-turn-helix domain-containing protein [Thermodesulfovibrio sp.]|nr:helix-turn-helix domain-containing protein [Thermodesulfovibrio sp.]
MKLPKSDKAIVDTLAFNPLMSIYRLCKETGYSTGTIPNSLQRLSSQNLVEKTEKGYALTFIGLMKFFLNHFEDPNFGSQQIKEIIQKYSGIMDYPLFTLHKEFEKWLGEKYYEYYIPASYLTNLQFESRIEIVWLETPLRRGEPMAIGVNRTQLVFEKASLEKEWQHAYTIAFFSLIKNIKPSNNPKINKFIKDVFKTEIQNRKRQMEDLENIIKTLTL